MKITKRQLKRIIREEKAKLLERMGGMDADGPDDYTRYQIYPDQFVNAAKKYLTDEEFAAIGQDKIEGIAIDNANELAWRMEGSLEGFGSSDRAAYIKYYLEDLGRYAARNGLPSFTADWKGPRGSLQVVREGKIRVTKGRLRRVIREQVDPGTDDKREELMDAIQSNFNLRHVRTSEEFDGRTGGVWMSGESGETASDGELRLFDYYASDMGPYEFGIHREFSSYIERLGWFAEWYDPGTIMLYEI